MTALIDRGSVALSDLEDVALAPAALATSPLLGTWLNTEPNNRGLLKVVIERAEKGITIAAFGSRMPRTWGVVPADIYGNDVTSGAAVAFSAAYVFPSKRTLLIGHLEWRYLTIETFHQFTDGSERSDYYWRYQLAR